MTSILKTLALLLICLVVWQAISTLSGIPSFILPKPYRVLHTLWTNRSLLAHHTSVTLIEIFISLILGVALGWISAIAQAASTLLRTLLNPVLVFSQSIPVFALAPLLTLWLGYGLWSKTVITVMIIYFPVTSSFFDALMRTPKEWLELAHIMGASPIQTMYQIRIPAALPGFASGLRLSAVYAPIGAIIGEWVGASQGLGYLMILANGRSRIDLMFAALLILSMLTLLLQSIVNTICRKFLDNREQ